MITQDTIDKRVGKIGNTLREKYDLSEHKYKDLLMALCQKSNWMKLMQRIMPTNQTTNLIDQIQAVVSMVENLS